LRQASADVTMDRVTVRERRVSDTPVRWSAVH